MSNELRDKVVAATEYLNCGSKKLGGMFTDVKNSAEEHQVNDGELDGNQQTILDIFRVVAALFVMVGHSFSFYRLTVFKNQTYFPSLQNIGVVIFFLLSGFLTAFSLTKKNRGHQYSFSKFFAYKTSRILKEYIPGLVLIAIIDFISIIINAERYSYYQAFNVKQFVGNALMLHNMGPYGVLGLIFVPFGSGRPLWTLPVEWWLYMLFGALFLSLSNRERISFPQIILFGVIVFMCSNYLITGRGNGLGFVFALGVLGYYCYELISRNMAIIIFSFSCILYIAYGVIAKEAYTVYSFVILWLVFCSAMRIGRGMKPTVRRNPVLAFMSKSTFMLYLIHYSIIDLFATADISWSVPFKFFAGMVISLVVSFLAYYVFGEKDVIGIVFNVTKNKIMRDR